MSRRHWAVVCPATLGACGLAQTSTSPNEGIRLEPGPAAGVYTLYWLGRKDYTYFIQHSEDLIHWNYLPLIRSGQGAILGENFPVPEERAFFRLQLSDLSALNPETADFDGDHVSNLQEVMNGTDPLQAGDADFDGLSNDWETAHGLNPQIANDPGSDDDHDGLTLAEEFAARSDPTNPDTDGDEAPDGNDLSPTDPELQQPRVPATRYAVLDLDQLGFVNPVAINDALQILDFNGDGHLARLWSAGQFTTVPNPAGLGSLRWLDALSHTGTLAANATVQPDPERDAYNIAYTWSPGSQLPQPLHYSSPLLSGYDETSETRSVAAITGSGALFGRSSGHGFKREAWLNLGPYDQIDFSYGLRWAATGGTASPFGAEIVHRLLEDAQHDIDETVAGGHALEQALDENREGTVVGWGRYVNLANFHDQQPSRATVVHGSAPLFLSETADSYLSGALSINNSTPPLIAGYDVHAPLGYYTPRAVLWTQVNGQWKEKNLGVYDPRSTTNAPLTGTAYKVNDRCEIVGEFHDPKHPYDPAYPPACLWQNGQVVDLESRTSGFHGFYAKTINNHGAILGSCRRNSDNGAINALLLPVELVSRDKFLAGSFEIPSGWDSLEMEFVGPGGENLGKYGQLLGGGSTKVYDSVTDILSEDDVNSGGQPATQKVWFVKDAENDRKINYYTCFNSVGQAEIKLYLNGSSTAVGSVPHELTEAQDFADTITYVDAWVKGTSFYLPDPTPPPGLMSAPMAAAQAQSSPQEGISNLTRACLIPFFNVINQVEGLSSVAVGLFDGVRHGVQDDWAFVQLVGQAGVAAGDWAVQQAASELQKWKDDPLKRASELKQLADKVCEDLVFEPLQGLGQDFSTWEGFKKRSWQTWSRIQGGAQTAWTVTKSAWSGIVDGMLEWADDFSGRMMTGSERAHWNNSPWVKDQLLSEINSQTRLMCYTFGYTFGYISEQIAVGALSAGTVKVAQVATKGGASLAANLAKRTAANLAARAHLLKRILAEATQLPTDFVAAYQRNLSLASTGPTGEGMLRVPLEVMQEGVAAGKLKWKDYVRDCFERPNVTKFCRDPAKSGLLERRVSQLMNLLGDDFSEEIGRNFLKVADEMILVPKADGTVDEFFEAFFKAFEGNPSLVKHADDVKVRTGGDLEPMSLNARARLKQFLTDPNAGDPWKLDVPGAFPDEDQFPIPGNYWTRGVLIELQQFKKVYRPQGYDHFPNATAYDYKGPKYVQMKSVANPTTADAIQRMRQAIDKLATAAGDETMILHIVAPNDNFAAMRAALLNYVEGKPYESRITILMEMLTYP